jgi:hypothetical protein
MGSNPIVSAIRQCHIVTWRDIFRDFPHNFDIFLSLNPPWYDGQRQPMTGRRWGEW